MTKRQRMVKKSLPKGSGQSGQSSDTVVCIAMAPGSAGGRGPGSLPQPFIEFSGRGVGTEPIKAVGGRISWMFSAFNIEP